MPETPDLAIAEHLLDMAHAIDTFGLWTGGPNFVDPSSERLDVPAAAYQAATGPVPFLFSIPIAEAADIARTYIEATPAAMDTLRALADHLARTWPDRDWTDDPIERLAYWPDLPGVTPEEITQTMRNLAHTLTIAATAPAAA